MKTVKEWPSNERIDAIGTNGNDGLHYPTESECPLSPNFVDGPKTLGDEEGMDKCLGDVAKLFNLKYGVDCGWGNLADEIEAKLACTTCEAVKPIYTQAMRDAGELPSVGMECKVFSSRSDKEGSRGVIEFSNELGRLFRYKDNNHFDWCDYYENDDGSFFGPITPSITLIDGNAYQFTNVEDNIIHGIYDEDENYFKGTCVEWSVSTCTNIKPLTVEVE